MHKYSCRTDSKISSRYYLDFQDETNTILKPESGIDKTLAEIK